MASLIYSAIASLDGYVEDEQGQFDWAAPDEEVHAFVNDLGRPVGTYLYGRRMYETMVYWETDDDRRRLPGTSRRSGRRPRRLSTPGRCRRCPARGPESSTNFDAAAIKRLKESSRSDITIGGAELAGQAIAAGLVDELQLLLVPVLVGRGKRALPNDVRANSRCSTSAGFRAGRSFCATGRAADAGGRASNATGEREGPPSAKTSWSG